MVIRHSGERGISIELIGFILAKVLDIVAHNIKFMGMCLFIPYNPSIDPQAVRRPKPPAEINPQESSIQTVAPEHDLEYNHLPINCLPSIPIVHPFISSKPIPVPRK